MKHFDTNGRAPYGISTCTYVDGDACGRPAAAHLLLSVEPLAAAALCPTHWLYLISRERPADFHPFGGACTMPGSVWVPTSPDARGGCTIPLDETEHRLERANQPEGALA